MPPVFTLASCSTYSLTLRMEVTCSSESSVDFQQTAWSYIAKDRTQQNICSMCRPKLHIYCKAESIWRDKIIDKTFRNNGVAT